MTVADHDDMKMCDCWCTIRKIYRRTLLKLAEARMGDSARRIFPARMRLPSGMLLPLDGPEWLAASFPVVLTLSATDMQTYETTVAYHENMNMCPSRCTIRKIHLSALLKSAEARMRDSARGIFLARMWLPSGMVFPKDGLEWLAASFPVAMTLTATDTQTCETTIADQ